MNGTLLLSDDELAAALPVARPKLSRINKSDALPTAGPTRPGTRCTYGQWGFPHAE